MSFTGQKGSSSEKSNQTSSQTETPNNLPALQQGWTAAQNLLAGTPASNAALALLTANANNASGAANSGLTTATNYAAPGATTNPANTYLTPFADGSMTGNNNPAFQNVVDQITRAAQQSTDGGFAASGRYGSGANANAFNSAVANEAGQLGYANYNDSVNRQLTAAQNLSQNNTNSVNQALVALGLVPGLGQASTGAGQAAYGAATAPTTTYADILSLLGSGGGTTNGTASGTASGTSSSMGFKIAPSFSLGPLKFGG
jgi:hypothetical protein